MSSLPTVPIIDVEPFLAGDPVGMQKVVRQVGQTCETIGFLVLTGHGLDSALQARFAKMRRQFSREGDVVEDVRERAVQQ